MRGFIQGPFLRFAMLALLMEVWTDVSCAQGRASRFRHC
jgi:hypothetical protein